MFDFINFTKWLNDEPTGIPCMALIIASFILGLAVVVNALSYIIGGRIYDIIVRFDQVVFIIILFICGSLVFVFDSKKNEEGK